METITMPSQRFDSAIHWKQLWSLAALYGSVIIGWIAYYRYQPKLLVEFHFTDFTFLLIVAQGIILIVTPPLAGKIGDKYRFSKGHRLPIITAGMSFAAMIFMAVAFTLIANPGEVLRWMLPVLIVFWLIGMSIFTSPALSTVELFAPVDKLPKAMAVLTIVANLIYALEPVIVDIIDFIGAPATFSAGGVVVFLSGYALKKTSLDLFKSNETELTVEDKNKKSRYGFIFVLGVGLGLATTVLFNLFPARLEATLGDLLGGMDGNLIIVIILVISAILSLPLSNKVNTIGLERSFWWSMLIVLVCIGGVLSMDSIFIVLPCAIIFAVGFTLLSVSSLPLVIKESSFAEKVFCVGIFYSGVALPDGIVESILAY